MDRNVTPWRARASQQFEEWLDSTEAEWSARSREIEQTAAVAARSQLVESLNQGLRRIRETETLEAAAIVAVELTGEFAPRCAIFSFQDSEAHAVAARGLGDLPIAFPPDAGAAFRTCVETKDPVIAIATASEISQVLIERIKPSLEDRVFLIPLTVRTEVKGILFAVGAAQLPQLELIAGMTALQMESVTDKPAPQRKDLVAIGGIAPAATARKTWTDLSPDLQALHLRAQREARLQVARIRLEHSAALRAGTQKSDIYGALSAPINAARESFRRDFIAASPTMVDYLYLEIVRGLAQGRESLLGSQFPGPQV